MQFDFPMPLVILIAIVVVSLSIVSIWQYVQYGQALKKHTQQQMNADKILADSREQQERTEAILSRQEALLAKAEILLYRLEERLAGEPIFGSEKGTFKISGGVEKDPPGNHQ